MAPYLVAIEDPVAAVPPGVRPHTLKITERKEMTAHHSSATLLLLVPISMMLQQRSSSDLPAPGSVMAIAPMHLPAVISGMKRSICSLLPYLLM